MRVNVNPSDDILNGSPMATGPAKPQLHRCSIIESFRSAPSVPPPSTLVNSATFIESKWSRDIGKDTATLTQKELEALNKEREELFVKHYSNLLFERSVDQIGFRNTQIDQEAVFGILLSSHNDTKHHDSLFALPVTVRRRIYDFCFPPESRKVSLSPYFATRENFAAENLASPWDILEPVFGGLHAFQQLRHELMTYFWTEYHFHVTLSPFTGPKFSPLSSLWLPEYLEIIQFLTVEADFTRFGFGAPSHFAVMKTGFSTLSKGRAEYGNTFLNKTENLLVEIVQGLIKRQGKTTMAEFNLMCRRYAGVRPVDGCEDPVCTPKSIPYCADNSLYLCDVVCDLRGILQKSRISGFTSTYTQMLIHTIFAEGDNEPNWNVAPEWDCAWPPVPINTNDSFELGRINQAMVALMDTTPFEPLPPTPTSSFAEEVESELLKYESSVYSERTQVEETPFIKESESQSTITPLDPAQKYQDCFKSSSGPNNPTQSSPQMRDPDATRGKHLLPTPSIATSRSATPISHESNQDSHIRLSSDSRRHLLAPMPADGSRCSTPESPNAMNRRNEQDPAFVRTVDALRSLDDGDKSGSAKRPPRKSMIPSPVRKREEDKAAVQSQTSRRGSNPQNAGTMRRYLSFVKRLRVPGV